MCVFVSRVTRAISTKLFVHVVYGCGSVLLQQGDDNPGGRGNFEGFCPIDNALYSIAFGTDTEIAEPTKMPFAMMTRVGCSTMC